MIKKFTRLEKWRSFFHRFLKSVYLTSINIPKKNADDQSVVSLNFYIDDPAQASEIGFSKKRKSDPLNNGRKKEILKILQKKEYKKVKNFALTVGKSNSEKHLFEYFQMAGAHFPELKSMVLHIEKLVQNTEVLEKCTEIWNYCNSKKTNFEVAISLDNYANLYEKGYQKKPEIIEVFKFLRFIKENCPFPFYIICNINRHNLWYVDHLLQYAVENHIFIRYRIHEIAPVISINDEDYKSLSKSNEDEAYHLAIFFKKLELNYELNETVKCCYRYFQKILAGESPDSNLNSNFKNYLLSSDRNVISHGFKRSLASNFMHEFYVSKSSVKEEKELAEQFIFGILFSLNLYPFSKTILRFLPGKKLDKRDNIETILITGWYGTETVGDKAILGGIVDHYLSQRPEVEFVISSFFPLVTERTLKELNIKAKIVSAFSLDFLCYCRNANEIVMGGGPLMGMGSISIPLHAFAIGKSRQIKTVVFGCGIGPVNGKEYEKAIKAILNYASEIKLRDNNSIQMAYQLASRRDATNIGDPAYNYVRKISKAQMAHGKDPVLACFLRDWPMAYGNGTDIESYEKIKMKFEEKIASQIKAVCTAFNLIPVFYSMHNFIHGGDDRIFYHSFAGRYFQDFSHKIIMEPSTVINIIEAMKKAEFNLCMRFHSVLFAHVINTNFFAIDYTNGGKIKGLLEEHNAIHKMIGLREFVEDEQFDLIQKFRSTNVVSP